MKNNPGIFDLSKLVVGPGETIGAALAAIDRNTRGIVLVAGEDLKLIGTVTDGDVRRWILARRSLEEPVEALLAQRDRSLYPQSVRAPENATREELSKLFVERKVRQIPLVDEEGRIKGLVTVSDILEEPETPGVRALVMAGGFGKRLAPFTDDTPKPMLPVGERPLLEHIIEGLKESGVGNVVISTHYMPEKITSHFGDGSRFGTAIEYVHEDAPLGTAGALGLLEPQEMPLLVMNGDILTKIDFKALLAFHREQEADITVVVREYDFQVPYGVVLCEGVNVLEIKEKPLYKVFVNAGIYILEPHIHALLPKGERMDMPDLIAMAIALKKRVASFPVMEYWIDIGRPGDYQQARDDLGKEEAAK